MRAISIRIKIASKKFINNSFNRASRVNKSLQVDQEQISSTNGLKIVSKSKTYIGWFNNRTHERTLAHERFLCTICICSGFSSGCKEPNFSDKTNDDSNQGNQAPPQNSELEKRRECFGKNNQKAKGLVEKCVQKTAPNFHFPDDKGQNGRSGG